jgi:hypothetical protein
MAEAQKNESISSLSGKSRKAIENHIEETRIAYQEGVDEAVISLLNPFFERYVSEKIDSYVEEDNPLYKTEEMYHGQNIESAKGSGLISPEEACIIDSVRDERNNLVHGGPETYLDDYSQIVNEGLTLYEDILDINGNILGLEQDFVGPLPKKEARIRSVHRLLTSEAEISSLLLSIDCFNSHLERKLSRSGTGVNTNQGSIKKYRKLGLFTETGDRKKPPRSRAVSRLRFNARRH